MHRYIRHPNLDPGLEALLDDLWLLEALLNGESEHSPAASTAPAEAAA